MKPVPHASTAHVWSTWGRRQGGGGFLECQSTLSQFRPCLNLKTPRHRFDEFPEHSIVHWHLHVHATSMSLVFFDYVYTKHTFTSVVILESFLVLARALPFGMDLLRALQVLFAVMIVLVSEGKSLFAEAYEDIFDAVHQQVEVQKEEFWQVCPRPKSCAAKVSVLFVFRPCLWWWRYTLSGVLLFWELCKR